jgi:hypothetical protein
MSTGLGLVYGFGPFLFTIAPPTQLALSVIKDGAGRSVSPAYDLEDRFGFSCSG